MSTGRAVIMAMLGKTLHYLELHAVLFSSAISTNYRLWYKVRARAGLMVAILAIACYFTSVSMHYPE